MAGVEPTAFGVVIPSYQRAGTLLRAIDSVLRQHHQALSLVVVDDGSTDSTGDVLRSVTDSRFRWIRQANSGRCAARNRGATLVDEMWLVFLDSDDEMMPGALAHLDELVRMAPTQLIVGANIRVAPDGSETTRSCSWDVGRNVPDALSAGSFAIHRSLFDAVDGYCVDLQFSEHTEMVFRMRSLRDSPQITRTDQPLARVFERGSRYDPSVQLATAEHLLVHIAAELDDDRHARSMFNGIAGVSAVRLGRPSQARRYLARSFIDHPRPRSAFRLANALLPGAARRWERRLTNATDQGRLE